MRVRALEGAVEKLAQVYSENMTSLRRAFQMVDNHTLVLQRLSHDLSNGGVTRTPAGELDLGWYYQQLNQVVQFSAFARWLDLPAKSLIVTAPNEVVEEFGGNYVGNP